MIHSKNVNDRTIEKAKQNGFIEIEFDNYNLSEEIRVNLLFKDFKKSKPTYLGNSFKKMYHYGKN